MLKLSHLAVLVCSLSIVSLSWAGGFHEDTLFNFNGTPEGIVAGPDGAMWFTDSQNQAVVRLAADGSFRPFPIEDSSGAPGPITVGPDGNLWFIEYFSASIGRATVGGEVTVFPVPTLLLRDIGGGPDGNVWFTTAIAAPEVGGTQGRLGGALGRITPSGTVSIFPVRREVYSLAEGPDDALWATSYDSLVRVTTGGQDQIFPVETEAGDITAGPDGAMWFTSRCFFLLQAETAGISPPCRYGIGRLTTDGRLTRFLQDEADHDTVSITRGPEDNLWFTRADGRISRLNLAGTVDDIVTLSEGVATDITIGPDGALWYIVRPDEGPAIQQQPRNRIGKVNSLAFGFIDIANSGPLGMAPGLNGSVWFTDVDGDRVGRLDRNGGLIQYELGGGRGPTAIAAAPDGGAWFTNFDNGTIGRITPDGEFVEFALPFPDDVPGDIVRGPDGNYWFISGISSIGRITPQGGVRIFPLPSDEAVPAGITAGPDGNLWFTELLANKIGRMSTDGAVVEFSIPTANSEPNDIATGPDGALYFTQSRIGGLARITTSGVITQVDVPRRLGSPRDIAIGPDGALWFSIAGAPLAPAGAPGAQLQVAEDPPAPTQLGRMARDGRVTTFDLPFNEANPAGIAGSDAGRLFVAMYDSSGIATIELVAAEPTPTATPTSRTPVATPTGPSTCVADCNGDRTVSIAELIAVVNIALGNRALSTCEVGDVNRDGTVSISELITAVGRALRGC